MPCEQLHRLHDGPPCKQRLGAVWESPTQTKPTGPPYPRNKSSRIASSTDTMSHIKVQVNHCAIMTLLSFLLSLAISARSTTKSSSADNKVFDPAHHTLDRKRQTQVIEVEHAKETRIDAKA